MPDMKELIVSISTGLSEVAKDNVLNCVTKGQRGNAQVIRDVNGKVIEVRITLPATASTAAAAAIAATPGVANVTTGDVTPDMTIWDGTENSLSQIQKISRTDMNISNTTFIYNADGTVDIVQTPYAVFYFSDSYNGITKNPEVTFELKMKDPAVTTNNRNYFAAQISEYGDVKIFSDGYYRRTSSGVSKISGVTMDSDYHTTKIVVTLDGTTATSVIYRDNVEIDSQEFTNVNSETMYDRIYWGFLNLGPDSPTLYLDSLSWTERP